MLEVPATFGKYFLTEKIATGGMAEIYLAKLLGPGGFEKQLVIKQIHPRLGSDAHFVDMFVAEAKTLVGLTHGNIVPVYELGVVDETYFIAMEYIDGPTLFRLLEQLWRHGHQLDPGQAAHLTAEILKGLDYAHRKGEGVIHRDLSPRNVMVSRDGEIKLVDFGIAIAGEDEHGGDAAHPVGSYPYMSPEQARGEPLTGQSDLFSVGVLLWEMLTGRQLFARETADETLEAVLSDEIPNPSTLRGGIPERLEKAVLKALSRDRAERYATARDFLADIHRFLYSLDPPLSAVEVAALVARHSPDEVVRPATGDDCLASEDGTAAPGDDKNAGPSTVVQRTRPVPRARRGTAPGEATTPAGKRPAEPRRPIAVAGIDVEPPKGKPRAPTMRSFATHVEFERVLARATPLFPIAAILEEPPPALGTPGSEPGDGRVKPATPPVTKAGAKVKTETSPRPELETAAADEVSAGKAQPATSRPRSLSPLARGLAMAALLAAVVASAWLWTRPSPPIAPGANAGATDAGPAASAATDAGPSPLDSIADAGAAPLDAAPTAASPALSDARPRDPISPRVRDAGGRVRPIADAAVATRAKGVLTVGANPWAEVYVDERKLGRTPGRWELPVGRHAVTVRFPVEGREQERRFTIDIVADTTSSLGVIDFSAP